MKKIIIPLFALFSILCNAYVSHSQTIVTVGSTTSYNSGTQFPTVYSRQYGSTRQQILIKASELTNAGAPIGGNINSIAFDVYSVNMSGSLPNYTIKIKQTTATSISTFDNTGLTQVYTVNSYTPTSGWNTHTFQNQFQWNGSSNIIIDICNSLTTTLTSSPNASVYINDPGFASNVLGLSNSVNQCGTSTVTDYIYPRPTMRFSITGNLPSCANLSTPTDGATSLPINTTLSWTNGGNTTSYDIYFGTTPNPPYIRNQTGITYNPGVLLGNTTYYWKIIARNSSGTAVGCFTRSFTTASDCPSNKLPANGSTNIPTSLNLSWNAVPLTSKYYIYLGTTPDPALYDSTANLTYTLTELTGNTTYYWKVVPRNQLGLALNCDASSFTTKPVQHWFVKTNGNDGASGNSWNNAKQDLSALLLTVSTGDSIHVAAGTYYPTRDKLNNTLPADLRDYCFAINQGVKLIGGYPSTSVGGDFQTSILVPRDPVTNQTILSGNIGTNDSLDNCYHVIWDSTSVGFKNLIDGFTITLGYANGSSAQFKNYGAGIYSYNGSLTILNSVFLRNYSSYGAGIYSNNCNLTIVNSTLTNNSGNVGSAICSSAGTLLINSSTINNNNEGEAIHVTSIKALNVDNCTFQNNYNEDISIASVYQSALPVISNSTLDRIQNLTIPVIVNNSILSYWSAGITCKYTMIDFSYYNGSGVSLGTGSPAVYWLNALADNGGSTKTRMLGLYNYKNPAVGMGNPAYAGLPDQRGVIRSNPPCIGAVEVSYARAADILINDTTIYSGNSVTLTAASATVSNPIFDWYSDAALTTHVYTGSTFTTPILNSNYYYYITVHNSTVFPNPVAFAKRVTIYVTQRPIITQQAVSATKCVGENGNFTVASYGPNLSYQWVKDNVLLTGKTDSALNLTNIQLVDSGYYYCQISNTFGTTNSDSIKLKVHSIPGLASPISGYTEICPGLNNVLYNSPAIADVTSYTWTLPNGATGISNTDTIMVNFSASAQPGNITVYGNNQCGSGAPSSSIITTGSFIPLTPGTITGTTLVCPGQNDVTYNISPVPNANSYFWTLPNGATGTSTTNNITVNYGTLATSGNITVKGINSCGEGSTSTLAITVNPSLPASVSIDANPSGAICQGTNVIFTAAPINGGSLPTYQWKKNGSNISGELNSTYASATLVNNDEITCEITSNATCVTGSPAVSNAIIMTVNPILPVSANIVANPSGAICAGTSVTFTATPINGGNSPTYQWKKNGSNISEETNATYSSTALVLNDVITCEVTSNATCTSGSPATSNAITMTVNPTFPVSVSIITNPNDTICAGTNANFTATPINGVSPSYQWMKNGTAISDEINATFNSTTLASNDVITCVITSDASNCHIGSPATSNAITMTVNPYESASISISASPVGAICEGSNVTFTAIPTNGGIAPQYQWKKNGSIISGATSETYSSTNISNGNNITCVMTSNLMCVTGPAISNTINMVVNSNAVASVSIAASPIGAICAGSNVTFTASPVNGGSAPQYQWRKNGININGQTNATYNTSTLENMNIISCIMTSNFASCLIGSPDTSNTIMETVNPNPPTPMISLSGNILHSSAIMGNQWYLNNTIIPEAIGQNYTPVSNGNFFTISTIYGCNSDTSNIITVDNIGIEESVKLNIVTLHPNPANDYISVETTLTTNNMIISVYDIQGQLLLQETTLNKKTKIDISKLAKGIYLLKLTSNGNSGVKRFVKE